MITQLRSLANNGRHLGWLSFTVVWLLLMLVLPIVDWLSQGQAFGLMVTVVVVAQVGAVAAMARLDWSWRRLADVLATIGIGAWLAEMAGSRFGLIFGHYDYSSILQPQLAGVPVLIPLAWAMLLPPSWAIASRFVSPRHTLRFALVSGLVFTAWDLYLDPQWVARGLWIWETPGLYFGIPLSNYLGWVVTSAVLTYLIQPNDLADSALPLAGLYTVVAFTQAVALGLFWNQPGPALVGFVVMGGISAAYWWKMHRQNFARFALRRVRRI